MLMELPQKPLTTMYDLDYDLLSTARTVVNFEMDKVYRELLPLKVTFPFCYTKLALTICVSTAECEKGLSLH